jgi:hypothetical protein
MTSPAHELAGGSPWFRALVSTMPFSIMVLVSGESAAKHKVAIHRLLVRLRNFG